jgi:cytochrome c oxidase cbb3-type subunit 2
MRQTFRVTAVMAMIIWLPLSFWAKAGKIDKDSELAKAPAKASQRRNPYAGRPEAVAAGKKLFERHCASCHGEDGRGRDKAPDLHTPALRKLAPGVLFWFLKNGDIRQGMPSWSRLPDQQLWQLVTYLEALK